MFVHVPRVAPIPERYLQSRPHPPSDEERWEKLYRQVPTAFWLDPDRYGDRPRTRDYIRVDTRPNSPPRSTVIGEWAGKRITGVEYMAAPHLYRLSLEGGEAVQLTPEMWANARTTASRFRPALFN